MEILRDIASLLRLQVIQSVVLMDFRYVVRTDISGISLKEKAGRINCRVENSCRDRGAGKEPDTGGIGLENMQKRLELIYGGHYVFRYGPEKDNTYSASLEIDII